MGEIKFLIAGVCAVFALVAYSDWKLRRFLNRKGEHNG